MKLGFIGFGGAGYGLAKGLHQTGLTELSLAKMERDILKKAAAYFAKESLEGTR